MKEGGASLATDGHDLGLGWINLEGCWEREMVPRVWEDWDIPGYMQNSVLK